jgi:hypothetical protein
MLTIEIPERDFFNEETCEFVVKPKVSFQIEHSLASISRWESKWNIPFLADTRKTNEQMADYIRCMTVTKNIPEDIYADLPAEVHVKVSEYIRAPMTATTLPQDRGGRRNRETTTSELIYFWMVSYNIPLECQKWHLNRLLTLIQICNIKNQKPGKRNRQDLMAQRRSINASRRAQYNSKG